MENTVKQRLMDFIKSQNITPATFERRCGLSNGYLKSLRECPSKSKLDDIFAEFPQLSRVWLLAGEGPMLNDGSTVVQGDGNTTIGDNSHVNTDAAILKAMEVAAKSQEHIDRLLAIIEKLT